jgi:hypothetical protein
MTYGYCLDKHFHALYSWMRCGSSLCFGSVRLCVMYVYKWFIVVWKSAAHCSLLEVYVPTYIRRYACMYVCMHACIHSFPCTVHVYNTKTPVGLHIRICTQTHAWIKIYGSTLAHNYIIVPNTMPIQESVYTHIYTHTHTYVHVPNTFAIQDGSHR